MRAVFPPSRLRAPITTPTVALVTLTGRFRVPAAACDPRELPTKILNAASGSSPSGSSLGCATYPHIRRLLPAANMEVSQ
ncbi:hypothetical protein Nocox_03505 [Nonomuraea coxensis DSM 45129]|uniref:Secreted protein n=1 Tax=Nonomuraea coxensis DSM 45129 TaxID=1122611 RepID=A0ABX8TS80_9ACTN|nr:hypothetical protein Nocox_03505 [Nonomuraea coxensis DSM 45129]